MIIAVRQTGFFAAFIVGHTKRPGVPWCQQYSKHRGEANPLTESFKKNDI